MKNRILSPSPVERRVFGLVAWLEQTRVVLPLKSVDCSFDVCGEVVSVEIDQIFQQNNPQPLDCLYTFPLPAGAAVYRCEMHVNGRLIRARVEEREAARKLAAEKKATGYRTALVEMERDNLFTLSLGNVQSGDLVVIRFAYFQTVTRLGDWTSFSIPFCPGIRYIPGSPLLRPSSGHGVVDDTDQVPDASRISPPRIDKLHPDAAYLSVQGKIEHPLGEVKDISSPTHPVFVQSASGCSTVTLADGTAIPDSDFIVRWTETTPAEARLTGWMTRQANETFALARFCAPREAASSDRFAQDFYFLIDRSGSMQGLKWKKAIEAFREFLKVLGDNDRVWATFFESSFQDLAEKPMTAFSIRADRWAESLESMGTAGGTELMPALEHVLEKVAEHSTGDRPASLLLITDGQVGNEAAVLKRLARHTNLRIDVFGIDVTINDGFLNKLAAQHQGASCLMSPTDDIAGAISRLGERLRQPVLTSIRITGDWEVTGRRISDLYAGEILLLPLRGRQPTQAQTTVTIEGKDTQGATRRFELQLATAATPAVGLLWAKQRINFLLAQDQATEAIALAKHYNLVCEGAAFVAWDEAEKVQVSGPDREIYQPSMAVAGAVLLRKRCQELTDTDAPVIARLRDDPGRGGAIKLFGAGKKGVAPLLANSDLQKLQNLCATVGHPEWMEKCKRLIEWASGNVIRQVLFRLRHRKLEVLIQMLENDAKRIVALTENLRLELEKLAPTIPALQSPLQALLNGGGHGQFGATHRQALVATLEQSSTLSGADKTRSLFGELDLAEKEMVGRIDDFLRRNVENQSPAEDERTI